MYENDEIFMLLGEVDEVMSFRRRNSQKFFFAKSWVKLTFYLFEKIAREKSLYNFYEGRFTMNFDLRK